MADLSPNNVCCNGLCSPIVSFLSAGVDPERCKAEVCSVSGSSIKPAATSNVTAMVIGHLTVLVVQNICKTTSTCTIWGYMLLEIGHRGLKTKAVRNNFQEGQRLFSCKHVCHPLVFCSFSACLCGYAKRELVNDGSAVWCEGMLSATCQLPCKSWWLQAWNHR